MANLATVLTDSAKRRGDRTAIKLDDAEVTYAQLDEGSARVAARLQAKGVGPGDRVGVMLPNVPYFPLAYYGALRAGAVVVPMNVLLKGREVTFYLDDPRLGEEVGAAVVLKDGEDADEDALREHCKNDLANYKFPRRIRFVDELPKTATGKILKREVQVPDAVQAG